MFALRPATSALLALAALLPACSATKAMFKNAAATEQGTEGWRKAGVSLGEIEAVRGTERVVIAGGEKPDTYVVKIDPKSLSFPTPPWGDKLLSTDRMGLNGEARVYAVPKRKSWDDVREWYLEWFEFKPSK
jgi:hypothetical protein